ncbi:MAG: DoxX family protein [Deltaproteobacteria bacterium]|nr:DoxX family protein [Deltaproteobacteria bacterium]
MLDFRPFETASFVALRIISGLLFALHGVQKIFGILADAPAEFGTQMWAGGLIELIGGVCIAIGLLTRPMAILASGTMAVAYIQFHWKGALDQNFFPAVNKGDAAVLYCFLFLYFALRRDNPASVDRLIFGKR